MGWTSTKMAPSAKPIFVLPSTMLASSWMSPNSTPCWEKLEVHAPLTTWSRCSKKRWLVAPTIPMTSLSVPSRPTRLRAFKIEAEMFRHALMNFGDKFDKAEVDDIFGEFEVDDDGFIASKDVIGLFVAGGGEEKKEEAPAPAEEAPAEAPAEEADDGGAKKKKKKKKAAK